jgi:hypothetical protein
LDVPNLRLVSFETTNLSAPCQFISLPPATTFFTYSYNVAYDFAAMHAYVISDISDGFVVLDIDLELGIVEDIHGYKSRYPAATVHLDRETQHLYIGLNFDDSLLGGENPTDSSAEQGEYLYGELPHENVDSPRHVQGIFPPLSIPK